MLPEKTDTSTIDPDEALTQYYSDNLYAGGDVEERVNALEAQVDSLRQTILILESLLHPQMQRIYQKSLSGLTVRADDRWRLNGFFPPEEGGGGPAAWSNMDKPSKITFFGVDGDVYAGKLSLAKTRNVEDPDPISITIDGKGVPLNRPNLDAPIFHFRYVCQKTSWHKLTLVPKMGLFDVMERNGDLRNLGVLFRELHMAPRVQS